MSTSIIQARLVRQQLSANNCGDIPHLVQWMGVMQAQDYAGAKWAIGQRMGIGDSDVDNAMGEGTIIRTHVLRPTWHFIAPQDTGWMLRLSAPRINQACAYNFKRMELDSKVFNKCNAILEKMMTGGKQFDRMEIANALTQKGIATDDLRLVHILVRAEIDGIICSGGRKGKQFTYALLDERLKGVKQFMPDEPLAKLAKRYFASHGPATLQDYTWWSGLKASDAKKGLEMAKQELIADNINDKEYWMGSETVFMPKVPKIILLPAYDEYTVAYKDRSDILAAEHAQKAKNGIFNPVVLLDGKIAGTWQRILKKSGAEVSVNMFTDLNKTEATALDKAITGYKKFVAR